jgi:putative transposase
MNGGTVHSQPRQLIPRPPPDALDLPTPASRDEVSPREMPLKLLRLAYPDRSEVRDVSANGGIRWHHQWGHVSHTCIGE